MTGFVVEIKKHISKQYNIKDRILDVTKVWRILRENSRKSKKNLEWPNAKYFVD